MGIMKNRRTRGEVIFDTANIVFMLLFVCITVYPFLYVLFASLSKSSEFIKHTGLLLKPAGFSLKGFYLVFTNQLILTGYRNTIFILVLGTVLSVLMTSVLAFALSRRNTILAKPILLMITFTMFFSGGIIPLYLVVRGLHLLDTLWSLIFPGIISTWNLIVMRTSFQALPYELEESAKIDGAGEIRILFNIILPVSKAIIAVMVLFYGVSYWNSWVSASMYIRKSSLFPLQLVLRQILLMGGGESSTTGVENTVFTGDDFALLYIVKNATIIVSTVPILLLYPFVQKYFVKGVMIGAIKG